MWYHGFISAHHPYYDFGILETNVGNSKRSAARLSFFNRGQFSEHPGSVSFVVFVLYCQLQPPGFARQTTGRQKRQEHFTNRQPPTRITPRTPRSSTIMPMRWTARIIPTCIASIRIIRSCMRKPKAQNVKFSTIRKSRRRCSARKISQKITTRYGFSGS